MLKSVAVISAGAAVGAIARWGLGLLLNAIFPPIPLGTLVANIFGGYCIGIMASFFAAFPDVGPEWRLLIITGFLGALTTFSTFSIEVSLLLQQQRLAMALAAMALHLFGSLAATFLGMGTFSFFKSPS